MIDSWSKSVVIWTFVIVALITLSAPTVVVLGASFTAGNIINFPPDGLSLKWYGVIAQENSLRQAFMRSLAVALNLHRRLRSPSALWPGSPLPNIAFAMRARSRSIYCCRSQFH